MKETKCCWGNENSPQEYQETAKEQPCKIRFDKEKKVQRRGTTIYLLKGIAVQQRN